MSAWILAQRPPKEYVDPRRPHGFFVELERTRDGAVEEVATLFLANRECPFRCLMCDLWKYTTDRRVPDGAVAAQVEWALTAGVRGQGSGVSQNSTAASLTPDAWPLTPFPRHIKLYNAGNFFDAQAIPTSDWPRLAELLQPLQTVIVECHPLLVGKRCLAFREMLGGELHVAMGLETIHPEVLPRLNKRMTLADFERATRFLRRHGIEVRAFLLLRPPFLEENEGIAWAKRSIEYAFDLGVECCVVIPTRAGNGAMEHLQEQGLFHPPRLESLEEVLEFGVGLGRGRVFADLWDAEKFSSCSRCGPARLGRLREMNLSQSAAPRVVCECGGRP
jgi:radical SAM enzyme (TIGR01210 family)